MSKKKTTEDSQQREARFEDRIRDVMYIYIGGLYVS